MPLLQVPTMAAALNLVSYCFDAHYTSGFGNEFVVDASGNKFRLHFTPEMRHHEGPRLKIRLVKDASAMAVSVFSAKLSFVSSFSGHGQMVGMLENISFNADGTLENPSANCFEVRWNVVEPYWLNLDYLFRCHMEIPASNTLLQDLEGNWSVPNFTDVILVNKIFIVTASILMCIIIPEFSGDLKSGNI